MGSGITVVGSFAVGMTIRSSRIPVFGETLPGADFDMGPGGKGSNQAVAAARLGADAALVACVGSDALADIAHELYQSEGVDAHHVVSMPDKATGVGVIVLSPEGENFIILDMGANAEMNEAMVDAASARIKQSEILMAVLEIPTSAAARALEIGRAGGALTILNPAPARVLPDEIFANVDVLTPNETELRILLGLPPDSPASSRELALELRRRGVGTVVVTLGREGALVLSDSHDLIVPPASVTPVDTTGAGDAFNAGLAVALAEGRALPDAVEYAAACGAFACTRLGVVPALGTRAEIGQFLTAGSPAVR